MDFMAGQPLCTMATVTADGMPEAAYVGFSQNDGLEIIVGTSRLSRKYQNLQTNRQVAIVIADTTAEVQYEGVATEITDEQYRSQVEARHFEQVPGSVRYRDDPSQVYFQITPTWLRFIQHGDEDSITEMAEF